MVTSTSPTSIAPPFACHPLTYPNNIWTCPVTGISLFKERDANLEQRERVVLRLRRDKTFRANILTACAMSPLLWVNLFGWTYRQFRADENGKDTPVPDDEAEAPFITWPAQDYAITEMLRCIREGRDLLYDKSRDQGATWIGLVSLAHCWTFTRAFNAKILSLKEEYVDSGQYFMNIKGDPSTMMWKFRYFIERLPPEIMPTKEDRYLRSTNTNSNGIILGESTNTNASRSNRLQCLFLDECAEYPDLGAIDRASDKAASCRIFNSTPTGPGYYSDLRFSGRVQVITLGWWDHPEQGKGRHVILENGKPRWHGPYREHALRTKSRRSVAQNLDIDHEQSGAMFFDPAVIAFQTQTYASVQPQAQGLLVPRLKGDDLDDAIVRAGQTPIHDRPWSFAAAPNGPLRLWCPLTRDDYGRYYPPRNTRYAMGIDIAQGVGASNSSIAVFARNTGEQVAEWTSSTTSPEQLARVAAMLGWWFAGGGKTCAYLAFEANGPGQSFVPVIKDIGYPWVYKHTEHAKDSEKVSDMLGWWNNDKSNKHSLGRLSEAMGSGKIIIRSPEALAEGLRYVFTDTGKVEPAGLHEEGGKARAVHGDRWRAIAVAWEAMSQIDVVERERYPTVPGTVEHQIAMEEAEEEARNGGEYAY